MPKVIEHVETTTAAPAEVFALWADVAGWPSWDEGIAAVTLDGPFVAGSTGTLKPTGGFKVPFALLEVDPGAGFTDVSSLPGCKLRFAHRADRVGDVTRVTHRADFSGPLAPFFAFVIGRDLVKELPGTVRSLCRAAEARAQVLQPA